MAAKPGRTLLIKKDNAVIAAGITTKSLTINNEPIDITGDDDDGWMTLLPESGVRSIEASIEGVLKSDALISQAIDGTALIDELTIVLPSGGEITGDFRFNNLEVGAPHNEAVTFSASFQSSGECDYAIPS